MCVGRSGIIDTGLVMSFGLLKVLQCLHGRGSRKMTSGGASTDVSTQRAGKPTWYHLHPLHYMNNKCHDDGIRILYLCSMC